MENNKEMEEKSDTRPSVPQDKAKLVLVGAIVAALVLSVIAAVVFGAFGDPGRSSGSESDNDFASMLPIYIAIWGGVFIPQIAMKRKRDQGEMTKEKMIVMSVILGLLVFGCIGLVLYMLLG